MSVRGDVIGIRKARGPGWDVGVVRARLRDGEPGLELRAVRHVSTLQDALGSLSALGAPLAARNGTTELVATTARSLEASTDLAGLRKAAGLSVERLADRAGVAASTVRRIEAGTQDPKAGTVRKLMEALR